MRFTVKALGASAALALGCVAGVGSGVAHADSVGTKSLYSPSALVLTVGKGSDVATAAVQRAVVLSCAPTPGGTHPASARACDEVRAVNGELQQLVETGSAAPVCTRIWDPVVVTADGVWEGERVSWKHTFSNPCMRNEAGRSLFAF
ncbi:subtilase-type protease inhibitor [Streptomyces ovatisporus]|uniref:Probable subtilase-type protease inhibitor n=1 Tax=Streptomyces ovatisporus TaxID=1128682 RepID=A0ABV9ACZ7_9ACTN